ncbi:MAG TPA: SusC/RagA family TonB-linked outer membrane protein [Puia sp.]|uniref:SusC/RagA family TonB-linked outer membrane protein n=1 Tax=Puia sp. TaxID=2045100 RepID=UPI002B6EE054|nr:SusC/RagA family TonB-linked outer membrane protein [Puia sp.]HVU95503.1 SusC/RagA family TonB-linked outer membrane protein [Puia sp.]
MEYFIKVMASPCGNLKRLRAERFRLQLVRVIRLTSIILLAACLQLSAAGFSQGITIKGKNLSLPAIFSSIEKQTGISFFYNSALIQDKKPQDVDIQGADLETALKEILQGQGLNFYRQGKTVFIVKKIEEPVKSADAPAAPEARQVDVRGKVTNEQGELLVGATVTIKGGKRGTLTDEKGQFYLKAVPVESTLQVTYTGYRRTEVDVAGDAPLVIKLVQANNGLDEAKVIAYGSTTERLSTGNVTTVKSEEIAQSPITNVLAALEGRVPGLVITQNSGMPGSSYFVQIRGRNSLTNGSDPYYVIDGVPYVSQYQFNQLYNQQPGGGNPLDYINPNDIESIEVLKDADATAIYGSKAANGAILITTKKGKVGKTRLDINLNQGIGKAPAKTHWMNTAQYLAMRREAIANDGDSLSDPNLFAPDLLTWDSTRFTNWQRLLTGNAAAYTDAAVSFSGGSPNTQYLFSADYNRVSTVFPFTGSVPRGAVHLNVDNVSTDGKFRLSLSTSYILSSSKLPASDLSQYSNLPPNLPSLYNKDGSLDLVADHLGFKANPLVYQYMRFSANNNNLVGHANFAYTIIKGLEIRTGLGYTHMQSNDVSITPIAAQDPSFPQTGFAGFTYNTITTWIAEPQLSYNFYAGPGKVTFLAGSTFQKNSSSGLSLSARGYTSDALIQNIQAAPVVTVPSTSYATYKYGAVFGRLSYDYLDKYILNFNWRRDGSSRFGPDNQFHNFGSLGVGYIFSKEKAFTENLSFLSFGKIRGSYGTTGNDQIGDYQYLSLYQTAPIPYQGIGSLVPTGLSNPQLAWEETRKFEGGLDLGFMKDRVLIHASYYHNRSSNQLVSTPLPSITGFAFISENLPAIVQNSGWEFALSTINIKSRNFTWSSSLNLTIGRNKLVAFPNLANSPYANRFVVGKPLSILKVFQCLGVDPETGVYEFRDSSGKSTFAPSYGIDNTAILDQTLKYYGGFQNTISYNNLELSFLFSFRRQMGLNYLAAQGVAPGIYGTNAPTGFLGRWRKPGDHATVERFTQDYASPAFSAYQYAQNSTYLWVNASFVRLSNLSLSYRFPRTWASRMHLQELRCYVHCQNLLTITGYKGLDPENQSSTALPPLRVITGGINFSL